MPKRGRDLVAGPVADDLVDPRGRPGPLALLPLAERASTGAGKEPLVDPALLRSPQLTGGLVMFFFQFLLQAGMFFIDPAVPLGRARADRLADGRAAAAPVGRPAARRRRASPSCGPRRRRGGSCRVGLLLMLAGIVLLIGGIDARRQRRRGRHPDAAHRPRHRRARLPARGRDRLGGARREERRGRRPAEHRHQPRLRRSAPRWPAR